MADGYNHANVRLKGGITPVNECLPFFLSHHSIVVVVVVVVVNEKSSMSPVIAVAFVVRGEPPRHPRNARQMMWMHCQSLMEDERVVEQRMLTMKHLLAEQQLMEVCPLDVHDE